MVYFAEFAAGFFLKKPRSKFVKIFCHLAINSSWHYLCRPYGGVGSGHPYLLISPYGKTIHRAPGNFETDQSSNKPVKAKLCRRKQLFLPLRILLLPTNPKLCKK